MRRQVLLTVAATTLLVLVAFLVPLALLIRSSTAERATSQATLGVQPLAAAAAVVDVPTLGVTVEQVRSALGEPVTVFLGDGQQLGDPRPVTSSVELARTGRAFTARLPGGGREILVPVLGRPEGPAVIRVEVPREKVQAGVYASWLVLFVLGVALLGVALLVGDRLARSWLSSVRSLTDTASRLGGGDLSARLRPGGPPEVADAGKALNRLGGRIGDLLRAEREAAADLSHRLRTPVTALRLDVDGLADPVERDRLGRDVAELSRAVDQVIAEARRPEREGVLAACDAAVVVSERASFWRVLAEDTEREMEVEIPSGPLPVRLSAVDLAELLDALLGNVFAHTPDGAALRVQLSGRPQGGARLVVEDDGPGLPGLAVVARGRSEAGSSGLGLDIVRRSAESSGGGLTVGATPAGGARVVVDLGPPR